MCTLHLCKVLLVEIIIHIIIRSLVHPKLFYYCWGGEGGGFSAGSGMRKKWFSRYQLSAVSDPAKSQPML